MHQSQTSGGDSWFPLRMGYTGATHGGRAVDGAPERSLMADEHTPGTGDTEDNAPPDRPASPWEPAPPGPSAPPPAWQVGAPTPAPWGGPPVAAPPRPTGARRPIFVAALTGALVGALVAGVVVAATRGDRSSPGRSLTFSANSSKIP